LKRNGQPEVYKLYKSMLSEEELECLTTIEMLRGRRKYSKTINSSATETLLAKKRGRKKKVEVVDSDTTAEEKAQAEPSEITNNEPQELVYIFYVVRIYISLYIYIYEVISGDFELFHEHILGVPVLLGS
jgi:spore germination cell wall hydrolase CwlJ-like protein